MDEGSQKVISQGFKKFVFNQCIFGFVGSLLLRGLPLVTVSGATLWSQRVDFLLQWLLCCEVRALGCVAQELWCTDSVAHGLWQGPNLCPLYWQSEF